MRFPYCCYCGTFWEDSRKRFVEETYFEGNPILLLLWHIVRGMKKKDFRKNLVSWEISLLLLLWFILRIQQKKVGRTNLVWGELSILLLLWHLERLVKEELSTNLWSGSILYCCYCGAYLFSKKNWSNFSLKCLSNLKAPTVRVPTPYGQPRGVM